MININLITALQDNNILKKYLLIAAVLFGKYFFAQETVSGRTMSENDMIVTSVLVMNVSQNKKVYSNSKGEFTIEASVDDEIRFLKDGYQRNSKKIFNFSEALEVEMIRIPTEIEELKILPLTGDLKKDSKRLTKHDKTAELQKAIGLPRPPEIMREKAPTLSEAIMVSLPFPSFIIDIDALYKVVSGDSRRMKALYKFEDFQRHLKWVNERVESTYFENLGIPDSRIQEFITYALLENPRSLDFVKAKNINGTVFELEKMVPTFIGRMNEES